MQSNALVLIGIGLIVGVYSGIMGLGGGTVMIPCLVLFLGFSQQMAVGTSLAAMLPPVTFFAVLYDYKHGNVKLGVAGWIALGIAAAAPLGSFFKDEIVKHLGGDDALKLVFGFVLVYIAGYTIFQTIGKDKLGRNMACAGILMAVAGAMYGVVRAMGE